MVKEYDFVFYVRQNRVDGRNGFEYIPCYPPTFVEGLLPEDMEELRKEGYEPTDVSVGFSLVGIVSLMKDSMERDADHIWRYGLSYDIPPESIGDDVERDGVMITALTLRQRRELEGLIKNSDLSIDVLK